ncbi:MAG TPA: hypothetical protein VNK43_12950 [Gemmatimonadales bacterium]|nr:hypothetical protein [Gemmatimonadales bacterium]
MPGRARSGSAGRTKRTRKRTQSKRATAKRAAAKRPGTSGGAAKRLPPGISRIDQASTRTHGYFVRVGYAKDPAGRYRPRFQGFFGDASHGGKRGALRAATAAAAKWRAELERGRRRRG